MLALLAACVDAPTAPQALQLAAGGREWLAIAAPKDLPTADTWIPFLMRQDAAGREAADRVRRMEEQAEQSQLEGEFAQASSLRRAAADLAVSSLSAAPSADVVLEATGSVDRWLERVDTAGLARVIVAATVQSVRAGRVAAAASLQAGDTIQAIRQIAGVSEEIRRWSPSEIAWRALQRAELGVLAMRENGTAKSRANHLARSAREELRTGDPLRALERSLYAIQVAYGAQLAGTLADRPQQCDGAGC